ncbi:WD40 repeat domain-containing protein [Azohydromonas caseinilytica]|uniref:WD40 repeat domain-containing protein n=1 Tax=Azohydromonas caseinilytica TaxID=2728836 RepID=A0A848F8K7_9BURK|nr:WD40 repeat domain-containing protein [Azohydromonas caseinilytica]NML15894.1 WD40 repeat domain-containing protein [Azohydromonas caseinilytica]
MGPLEAMPDAAAPTAGAQGGTSTAVALDREHPWPGLAAYDEASRDFFHGRDEEAAELLRLIRLAPLTVLYGKSGLGKSSLLQAGVFPALRAEHHLPVYVRVDFSPQAPCPPLEQVARRLEEEIARVGAEAPPRAPGEELWTWLHRRDLEIWSSDNFLLTPVLVFDQFEELFSRGGAGRERIGRVFDALADLIENRIPAEVCEGEGAREALRALDLGSQRYRVVLSFREDFLPEIESWKDRVPSLLRNRLRLLPMSRRQAVAATERAGAAVLAPGVAARIVDFVAQSEDGVANAPGAAPEQAEVEPVLLSLCCTQLNQRRAPGARVDAALLASAGQDILQSFHDEALAGLAERVPRFIETHLIQGDRYRGSFPRDEALQRGHLTIEELAALTERHRLLRIEQQQGVARIELIHDRLVGIVARSRDARLARDRELQREHERQHEEAQRLAQLERRRREQAERSRAHVARMRNGLVVLTALLCVLLGFALWAFEEAQKQQHAAQDSSRHATTLRLAAEAQAMLGGSRVEGDERALLQLLAAQRLVPGAVDGALLHALLHEPGLLKITHVAAPLRALAVSPDGTRIATACDDHTVQLWDAASGRPAGAPLIGHLGRVSSVAFSPDGRRLVSGSDDHTLRLWDLASGRPLGGALQAHQGPVLGVAFSPDGRQVVSASADRSLRRWDAAGGQPLGEPLLGHAGAVTAVAFSPDGRQLVSAGADRTLRRWDATTGAAVGAPLEGHADVVNALAFSPDGARLASASEDASVRLWDGRTGRALGEPLHGHLGGVSALAFSPDGTRLISAGADDALRLWDVREARPLGQALEGHKERITAVAYSADGRQLFSTGLDASLRWWRADAPVAPDVLMQARLGEVRGIDPARRRDASIAGVQAYSLQPWIDSGDLPPGAKLPPGGLVLALAWSPDGTRLVTGHGDHALRLWDAATGQPLGGPLHGHEERVTSVAFSPDGRLIVSGSADRTLRRWDAATGQPLGAPLARHRDRIAGVAFSPDGRRIASAGHDGLVRLWDAATGQAVGAPLESGTPELWSVAWSPDGRQLVAGDGEGRVHWWDAATGRGLRAAPHGHKDRVMALAFSRDGTRLASAGWDRTLRLWDSATGQPLGEPLQGHKGPVLRVVFRPDGQRLVSGSWDGKLRLWETATGRPVGVPLEGQQGPVAGLAFSPDGERIAAMGGLDATPRLWPAPSVWPRQLCSRLTRNMSAREWREWVSPEMPYVCQCPGLPVTVEEAGGHESPPACAPVQAAAVSARP